MNRALIAQILRFLLLGGLAAAINWLARFPLSLVMPFSGAILVAYMIGMTAGFALYRAYVFPGSTVPMGRQVAVFLLVNAAGAVVVWSVAMALAVRVFPAAGYTFMPEATAHGIAIGVGAAANFVGHKFLTFRRAPDAALSAQRPGGRLA